MPHPPAHLLSAPAFRPRKARACAAWGARTLLTGALLWGAMAAMPSAMAQDSGGEGPAPRAAELEALVACRATADPAARLACLDAAAARLDEAERTGAIVVADRARISEARRGLFGFNLPRIGLFGSRRDGGGADVVADVEEIETTIESASPFQIGRWRFRLADGSVWTQADSKDLRQPPKRGTAIRIKRAALGSYLATIGGQPGIRVRREN